MSDLRTKLDGLGLTDDELDQCATCVLQGDDSNLPIPEADDRYVRVTNAVRSFNSTCAVYTGAVETRAAATELDPVVVRNELDGTTQSGFFAGTMSGAQSSVQAVVAQVIAQSTKQHADFRAEFNTALANQDADHQTALDAVTAHMTELRAEFDAMTARMTARMTVLENERRGARQVMEVMANAAHGAAHVVPDDHGAPHVLPDDHGAPHVLPDDHGAPHDDH